MFASLDTARITLNSVALEFDASALSPEAATRVVDQLGAIRRVVDGMLGQAAKRVAETSADNGCAAVGRLLGIGTGEVRSAVATAKKLEALPATDAAVRAGRLSSKEATLIADAATLNPDAEAHLLGVAKQGLVPLRDACVAARAAVEAPRARRERHHREREFRFWTDRDGMWAGRFRYTPEIGGQLKVVIEEQVQRIFREHKAGTDHESNDAYAADAVAAFVLDRPDSQAAGTSRSATKVSVHVVVGHETLKSGELVPGEVCEIPGVGPVDVNWVREQLGSAFVTAIIKRGKDILTVAHLGRHIPAELMTALLVGGRECDAEGCNHRGYLERDHVHDHAKGGPTSYKNLCWLCYRHHRLKSSGWQLGPPDPETRKRKLRPPPARGHDRAPGIRWRGGRRSWSRGTPRNRRRRARGPGRFPCSHRTESRDRTTGRR